MNVIWVATDNNKNGTYIQTKPEVLCLVSCLSFIKHYYPSWKTYFYVDKWTKEYYRQFGILDLFDTVDDKLLDNIQDINIDVFWAAGKIIAQRNTPGPTLTIDLDMRIFHDIQSLGFLDGDISCLWLEIMNEHYISHEKALQGTNLSMDFEWDNKALNVSILHIKNEWFKNLYCDTAIEYMKAASKILNKPSYTKFEKDGYILFAEQYLLHELSKKYNQQIKLFVSDYRDFIDLPSYITSIDNTYMQTGRYLFHYAGGKVDMRERKPLYYSELSHMNAVTNNIIKDEKMLSVFNKIYNMSDDERCFC